MSSDKPSAAGFDTLDSQASAIYNDPEFTPYGAQKGRWRGYWTNVVLGTALAFAFSAVSAVITNQSSAHVYAGMFFIAAATSTLIISHRWLRGRAKVVAAVVTILVFVFSIFMIATQTSGY